MSEFRITWVAPLNTHAWPFVRRADLTVETKGHRAMRDAMAATLLEQHGIASSYPVPHDAHVRARDRHLEALREEWIELMCEEPVVHSGRVAARV